MTPRGLAGIAAAALLAGLPSAADASHRAYRCTAPAGMTQFKVELPITARAIRRGKALVIVAIGSSSTQGVGASDPAHAYPSLLAGELRRRWPHLTITVHNKGVGGEVAGQMLARFERDVMPHKPHLVIWQTGSNHALRRDDVKDYAETVREGVKKLKAARVDVILMDPQYAPRVLDRPAHKRVVAAVGQAANDLKVAVFQRFEIMRHWVSSGQHKVEDLVSRDRLHMNDVSYSCIARLLAESLDAAARAAPAAGAGMPPPAGGPPPGPPAQAGNRAP
ncbi:MAG: SGNH/GDSL hydrolase family protein [Nitrospinota bacterium]